jgi:hypothetical protein
MKDPRPVTQCDLEGNPIERFPSISAACKTLGVVDATIRKAVLNNKIVLDKYRFRFDTIPVINIQDIPAAMDPDKTFTEIMASITPEDIQKAQDKREIFADLSQNPDRWLSPFERIINRREK